MIPKASYVCLKLTQVFHPKQLVSSRTHQAKKELKAPLSPSFYHKPFQKNTGENTSFIHPKTYSFCIPCSWLEHLTRILDTEFQGTEAISWAAYHAQSQQHVVLDSDVSLKSLLPLFHHEAKSVAMICHCMNIVRSERSTYHVVVSVTVCSNS